MYRGCEYPRCSAPAVWRGYCRRHGGQLDAGRRKPADVAFYQSPAWRAASAAAVAAEPLCRICRRKASALADHIVERRDGGADFARRNIQAVCWSCHSKKTKRRTDRGKGTT
jgi:5-methylcytosine-specific restriction enzyme A